MSFSVVKYDGAEWAEQSELLSNMYIIHQDDEFLVIDPSISFERVKAGLENKKCVGIFLTHAHYDHFSALESWVPLNCPVYLSEQASEKLHSADQNGSRAFGETLSITLPTRQQKIITEGDTIMVGSEKGSILHFPGHSNCSLGLIIKSHFFCGDFIFEGGNIGRYDFPTGSMLDLRTSLRRLKELDSNLIVHSGHGQDFILKDYYKA